MKTLIACVGGFLGAGKTTALIAAAKELERIGKKVAIITNDQGSALVDTQAARSAGLETSEITGGCFCCKFDDFLKTAIAAVEQSQPDIILAEAVGSCTDLSATVYQPLKTYHSDKFSLAPLTVFVEPNRIHELCSQTNSDVPESVSYLFRKQFAEADIVILNKVDTVSSIVEQQLVDWLRKNTNDGSIMTMSAATSANLSEWLKLLLQSGSAGNRLLEIDYDQYAEAEALLGWLNAAVTLTSDRPVDPKLVATSVVKHVQRAVYQSGGMIAHLKLSVSADGLSDQVAVVDQRSEPRWRNGAQFAATHRFKFIANARVCCAPDDLERFVRNALGAGAKGFGLALKVDHLECFAPARPEPQHRFLEVVH